jgi:mRNA interferase MazF
LPSHVKIPSGIGGLKEDSVLLCEQIRVVDKKRLVKKLGKIEKTYLEEIHKALKTILGLR